MKIIIYSLLIIHCSLQIGYSQSGWYVMNSGTQNILNGMSFINGLTGWCVGSNGTILKTVNSGMNWTSVNGGTQTLNDVHFFSATDGVAIGNNGIILRTNNGGSIWAVKNSGTISNLRDLYFLNSPTGWCAGENGVILKTTNGGTNWIQQSSGVTANLNSIHFIDLNTGWAVGETGKILKTTNSGVSWTLNVDLLIATMYSVHFFNSNTGFALGKYTDGGGNTLVFCYKTTNAGFWWEYGLTGSMRPLKNMFVLGQISIWAAGDAGAIFGSTNGGINWIYQNSRTTNNLNRIFAATNKIIFACGENGTIVKSENGGYRDTLNTSRRDLGVIPIVENVQQMINAKYRVIFRSPDTTYNILRSFNNGASFDTLYSEVSLTDTGKYIDGLLLRVKKIFYNYFPQSNYLGTVGVIKDPVSSADINMTRLYCFDYRGGTRNLTGSRFKVTPNGFAAKKYQSDSMSLSYPVATTFTSIGSAYKPDSLRKVMIKFTGYGNGQYASRYYATNQNATSYDYRDKREVPFKVYDVDELDGDANPRQINCAFLEFDDSLSSINYKWEPTADSLGGKDILYIFGDNYDTSRSYPSNLFIGSLQANIMYVWAARLINPGPAFTVNDEMYFYPYTITKPYFTQGHPVYYDFTTNSVIGIQTISTEVPSKFSLMQNYPNPFNPNSKIKFSIGIPSGQISKLSNTRLIVYDVLGREVQTLVNEQMRVGTYEVEFDGNNFASGVYFYSLVTDNFSQTKKMVLIK